MICHKCNAENSDRASFCRSCGSPLSSVVSLNKEKSGDTASNPINNQPSQYNPFVNTTQEQNYYQQNEYQQPYNQQMYNGQQYNQMYPQQIPNYPPMPPQNDEHVSRLLWLGIFGMNLIPYIGSIIYIIMLFVWSFGGTNKKSLKTYAQAQLIFLAVVFVICLFIMLVVRASFYDYF